MPVEILARIHLDSRGGVIKFCDDQGLSVQDQFLNSRFKKSIISGIIERLVMNRKDKPTIEYTIINQQIKKTSTPTLVPILDLSKMEDHKYGYGKNFGEQIFSIIDDIELSPNYCIFVNETTMKDKRIPDHLKKNPIILEMNLFMGHYTVNLINPNNPNNRNKYDSYAETNRKRNLALPNLISQKDVQGEDGCPYFQKAFIELAINFIEDKKVYLKSSTFHKEVLNYEMCIKEFKKLGFHLKIVAKVLEYNMVQPIIKSQNYITFNNSKKV